MRERALRVADQQLGRLVLGLIWSGAKLLRLGLVTDKLGLTGLGLELAQIGPLVWVMKSLLKWAFWAYKMSLEMGLGFGPTNKNIKKL